MKAQKNPAHILLEKHLAELGLYWLPEYRFNDVRRWRLDYLLTSWKHKSSLRIGIEIDGGVYSGGRHVRGAGFENDMRKLNTAEMQGIRVLRFSTNMVLRGEAKAFLAEHLGINHAK